MTILPHSFFFFCKFWQNSKVRNNDAIQRVGIMIWDNEMIPFPCCGLLISNIISNILRSHHDFNITFNSYVIYHTWNMTSLNEISILPFSCIWLIFDIFIITSAKKSAHIKSIVNDKDYAGSGNIDQCNASWIYSSLVSTRERELNWGWFLLYWPNLSPNNCIYGTTNTIKIQHTNTKYKYNCKLYFISWIQIQRLHTEKVGVISSLLAKLVTK